MSDDADDPYAARRARRMHGAAAAVSAPYGRRAPDGGRLAGIPEGRLPAVPAPRAGPRSPTCRAAHGTRRRRRPGRARARPVRGRSSVVRCSPPAPPTGGGAPAPAGAGHALRAVGATVRTGARSAAAGRAPRTADAGDRARRRPGRGPGGALPGAVAFPPGPGRAPATPARRGRRLLRGPRTGISDPPGAAAAEPDRAPPRHPTAPRRTVSPARPTAPEHPLAARRQAADGGRKPLLRPVSDHRTLPTALVRGTAKVHAPAVPPAAPHGLRHPHNRRAPEPLQEDEK